MDNKIWHELQDIDIWKLKVDYANQRQTLDDFIKAIEQKLKEKNHGTT